MNLNDETNSDIETIQGKSSLKQLGHGGVAINTENIHLKSDQISQKSSPTLCREVYFPC